MALRTAGPRVRPKVSRARDQILDTAYNLLIRNSMGSVGVDTIIEEAGVAKMSLYRHFRSKEELMLAVLKRREDLWTVRWLASEIAKRASSAEDRLLCIFDIFDEWFRRRDFEGCTFVNVLLEAEQKGSLHRAAATHLAEIRSILSDLAAEARLAEVEAFAQTWHILMKGSIIAAGEGTRSAAGYARNAGRLILAAWPREETKSRCPAGPVRAMDSERVSLARRRVPRRSTFSAKACSRKTR
jgi:AcrR family transcriptional regulator